MKNRELVEQLDFANSDLQRIKHKCLFPNTQTQTEVIDLLEKHISKINKMLVCLRNQENKKLPSEYPAWLATTK